MTGVLGRFSEWPVVQRVVGESAFLVAVTVGVSASVDENHLPAAMRGPNGWPTPSATTWLRPRWTTTARKPRWAARSTPTAKATSIPAGCATRLDSVPLPGPSPSYLVTVHAFYGIYVNNGTRYIAPNPFWDRAQVKTEAEAPLLLDRLTRQMAARYLHSGAVR